MNTIIQQPPSKSRLIGFTLIELLVVIALIGILSAGIGLSLGKGDRSTSLKNAQATVSSALSGARAQAALGQNSAAIFINADPTSDNFLREFRIALYIPATSAPPVPERWLSKGDAILLPSGVYLVPPASAFTTSQVEFKNTWTELYTTAYSTTSIELTDEAGVTISSVVYHKISSFTVQGTTTAGQLVLASGEMQSDGKLVLDKPESVRGMLVSQYGVATVVNEPAAFQ
jgi:prepilin-type N-terminal cleavage/methylation domain-containing protein